MKGKRARGTLAAWVMAGLLVVLCLAAAFPVVADGECDGNITNPSFETGDLTGWEVGRSRRLMILPRVSRFPWNISWDELEGILWQPTDGEASLWVRWGGTVSGNLWLTQDVTVPTGLPLLVFDYRARWVRELSIGGQAQPQASWDVPDQHFYLVIQEAGGGAELARHLILLAPGGELRIGSSINEYTPSESDTGVLNAVVDMTEFAGQEVRLMLEWEIPAPPLPLIAPQGLMQVDNFRWKQIQVEDEEDAAKPDIRTDVSVIVYGGWNGMVARCWVGGTQQPELITAVNSFGDAQAMWTLYPTGTWPVAVNVDLPAGLDPDHWEMRLVRISSPTMGWSNDAPGAAASSIIAGQQYQFVYQLVSK